MERFKHPQALRISALAWHPHGNEIAWAGAVLPSSLGPLSSLTDMMGKFSVWRSPIQVASYNIAPDGGEATVAQAAATIQADLSALFDDDDEDDVNAIRKRRLLKKKQQAQAEKETAVTSAAPPKLFSLSRPEDIEGDGIEVRVTLLLHSPECLRGSARCRRRRSWRMTTTRRPLHTRPLICRRGREALRRMC